MRDMRQGHLFVVSGPSGAGKGAICAAFASVSDIALSVSMTTRMPRAREEEGKSYYFVDRRRFRKMVSEGGFFEYAEVHGEYYGTPKAPVTAHLEAGKSVILEIDPQGAMQIRASVPDTVLIFILPPSFEELKKRIKNRGSETPESMRRRLAQAENEIAQIGRYDYCVVNDILKNAIKDVFAIIRSERTLGANGVIRMMSSRDMAAIRRAGRLRVDADTEKLIQHFKTGG